jgi:hypothetical protein
MDILRAGRTAAKGSVMTTAAIQPIDAESYKAVAPYWHTAILVGLLALIALSGAAFQYHGGPESSPAPHGSLIPLYLSMLAAEWGLLTFARKGSLLSGTTLTDLIGSNWWRPRGLLSDGLLGVTLWVVWEMFEFAWTYLFGAGHAASI